MSVDEVALLSSLTVSGPLPAALGKHIPRYHPLLGGLILDGLVEVYRDGRFQTGAAVVRAGCNARGDFSSEVERVSWLGLEYAVAVRHLPVSVIAERLYAFNSLPVMTGEQGNEPADFLKATGIDANDPSPIIGGHRWAAQACPAWLYLRRGDPRGGRFKLYVSPHAQAVTTVLHHFAEVLGDRAGNGCVFKIAFPSGYLRRPDKIVAYFSSFMELEKTLSQLRDFSFDAAVQAVPFSAPVSSAPLLSWGVDPPDGSIGTDASWRSWLTAQIAECVHAISADKTVDEALEQLTLALSFRDIDSITWLPRQELLSRKWGLDL